MNRSRRLIARFIVASIACGVVVAPFAAAAFADRVPPTCTSKLITISGPWRIARAPAFKTGAQTVTDHTWDAYDEDNLYVTNGKEVQASRDAGCHWTQAYALPSSITAGFSSSDSTITSIEVPESSAAGGTVFALVAQTVQGVDRTHVVVSRDAGRTWNASDGGLPPTGRPVALRVAPFHPDTVYVAIDENGGSVDLIYASEDGGRSWSLRSDLTKSDPNNVLLVKDLQVDPAKPEELWAPGGNGLYRSKDGGRSFEKIPEFQLETGPVDVFHGGDQPGRVAVFLPGTRSWSRSETGGVGWSQLGLRGIPGTVDSAAHGPAREVLFVTAGGNAYAWNEPTLSWVDLRAPAGGLKGMLAGRGTVPAFSAHTSSAVLTYVGPVSDFITTLPQNLIDVPQIVNEGVPQSGPPTIGPKTRKVVLGPGKSKTVPFKLNLPSRPVPLDVYFLLDTSASTTGFLENVARSIAQIANALGQSGIDVHWGLADYRAYPNRFPPAQECQDGQHPAEDKCEANYVYRRDLDIGATGKQLEDALEALRPDGGGAYRSQYSALFHSVNGAAEDLGAPGTNPVDHDVPPGTEAHFRAKAVKVIIHATDESFGDKDNAPAPNATDPASLNQPKMITELEAVAALNSLNVYQVGISTGSESRDDLETMATDTGAVAPGDGVDCNGDGAVDVDPGDPLVCSVNPNQSAESAGLVPGIEDLLASAIKFRTDVTLKTTGGTDVVQQVAPATYSNVILQTAESLDFDVTFHCPTVDAGKRFKVRLTADADDLQNVSSTATVVCRPLPEAVQPTLPGPPLAPPAAAALVAIAAPPPPPPPPPVIELSSATQSQTQIQAQAGMAYQEETQPQTAFVAAFDDQSETDFAFSSYRDKGDSLTTPLSVLGAGAVVISFAFGFLTLSRELAREKVLNRRR